MSTSLEQLTKALRASVKETQRLRRQNRQLIAAIREPIAIVGMGCRYPGGVCSPEELWELVAGGVDAIDTFPTDRGWDLDRLYDPDPDRIGASYVSEGGFLYDAAEFDSGFFGLQAAEARAMDPQQRAFLEASWEALERAMIDPARLRGSPTGVFAGVMYEDYLPLGSIGEDTVGGNSGSLVSGRLAYTLGLEGPAVTVNTACSSSLVGLHLACQALRAGECSLALAGGVTIMGGPAMFIAFCAQRTIALDARCKAFAEGADGTILGEGVGVLVLERLSDARRLRHPVLALVRGSAVNQDGASNGLAAPNGPAQERVIRQALATAGLSASEVDAVEAHGTGTALGDPIEAQALLSTYGSDRPGDRPLWLGSVKSNIGHAQAAAGVAGVIKMVMAMRHATLPRTLHVHAPSSHVDWSSGDVRLLTEAVPWPPRTEQPRRAAVSSFGVSGTNAHAILEEPPAHEDVQQVPVRASVLQTDACALVVSAASEAALSEQAARLCAFVGSQPDHEMGGVSASLTRRSQLEWRGVVLGRGRDELARGLGALAQGSAAAGVVRGRAGRRNRGGLVFVFPGQGSQWDGMALELLEHSPLFAQQLRHCSDALAHHTGWSVEEVLRGECMRGELQRVDVVQPCLFAVVVALAELWRCCGVQPDAVLGHSQGEMAAACVAGALSLQDAARVVALRSRALLALSAKGGMLSIAATPAEVEGHLRQVEGDLAVTALNGPASVAVSGEPQALERLREHCQREGLRARRILIDYASHSPQVERIREELLDICTGITPRSGNVAFYSSVLGGLLDGALLDGDYWYRNLRETVRFDAAAAALVEAGHRTFVEISPHPVLGLPLSEIAHASLGGAEGRSRTPGSPEAGRPAAARAHDAPVAVLASLRRGQGGPAQFLRALGEAWVHGVNVEWESVCAGSDGGQVGLPVYPFQRKRFWLPSQAPAGDVRAAGSRASGHPLLGAALSLAGREGWVFSGRLAVSVHAWLADHVVAGVTLLPASAFVELALAAARHVGCGAVEELMLQAPLVIDRDGGVHLQVTVGEMDRQGRREVAVYSCSALELDEEPGREGWECHARGLLGSPAEEASADAPEWQLAPSAWPPPQAQPLALEGFYEDLAALGLEYGPAFQGVAAAWRSAEELFVELELAPEQAEDAPRFIVHPALLDAALHAGGLLAGSDRQGLEEGASEEVLLPFSLRGVRIHQNGAHALRARIRFDGEREWTVAMFDDSGMPVASVAGLIGRPLQRSALLERRAPSDEGLFAVEWIELSGLGEAPASEPLAVLLGQDGIAGAAGGLPQERYADLAALVAALQDGDSVPEAVFVDAVSGEADGDEGLAGRVHASVRRALSLVNEWLAHEPLCSSRLVFVSRGAVAVAAGERPDPVVAAVWGLVRGAQAEYPGRFTLVDLDPQCEQGAVTASWSSLLESGEPQLALRGGRALALRLVPFRAPAAPVARCFDPEGTVLITGASGGLGRLVACHLARVHGARHLLLVSRSGPQADGMQALVDELEQLGCAAAVAACDAADRAQLARLLDSIPAERPLTAVVHAAGVIDDATIASLGGEQLERVLRPKVDAVVNLHDLTDGLAEFVLFSSLAGTVGGGGQANYAAANAFMDAFACVRHEDGLPAVSLGWGMWAEGMGMIGGLDDAALARLRRVGVSPLSAEDGMSLFDRARSCGEPWLAPARLDAAALRAQARMGVLPAMLRSLVRVPARRASAASGAGTLALRLAAVPREDWEQVALEVVSSCVAGVLGAESAGAIDSERNFTDLGFDSLTAVELRNVLQQATGLLLPATLVFDHPTPAAVASLLCSRVQGVTPSASTAVRRRVAADEPIAIVGMSCRYPGGVRSPEDLWRLVSAGTDAVSSFPSDRGWDLERLYDPDGASRGTTYACEGGFLYDAAEFDAEFFGISPREALSMDPQQRLALEAAWEALEDAGIDPHALEGSSTGVFAGVMYQDYGLASQAALEDEYGGQLMLSAGGSVVSGRLSYTLGLEGPAVTVDTACSSSLVAIHLACQSLRADECSLALAGGVTVLATPAVFVAFSGMRALARDGRCRSFADAADGMGWSEGLGLVALERLSDAQRRGHEVLALVRGSAVNQDGASNGLTAPNGPAQERVIRQALANAGVSVEQVDAVEGHGTGTTLGDPIEAQALLATYGQRPDRCEPLRLGSLKSNLGHTQAAAGVAGVIKMVMAMRHGVLPKTLHVDTPSTHVDWSSGAVSLLSEPSPWPPGPAPRRAGISSFGMSGTNAHMIVEEAPNTARAAQPRVPSPLGEASGDGELQAGASAAGASAVKASAVKASAAETSAAAAPAADEPPSLGGLHVWVLSGKGDPALGEQAARLREHLHANPGVRAGDVGFSLASSRSAFRTRAAIVGEREELVAAVEAIAQGGPSPCVAEGEARSGGSPLAFLFTGQGAQRVGMGRELYQAFPVFKHTIDEAFAAFEEPLGRSLREVMFGAAAGSVPVPNGRPPGDAGNGKAHKPASSANGAAGDDMLHQTAFAQAGLFALEIALFRLLEQWHVRPGYLIGHSIGELAAVHVAGALSLPDACKLVAARGRLMQAMPGGGAMVAVEASEQEMREALARNGSRVALAAVNGPRSVVLSGEEQEVLALQAEWAGRERKTRRLRVSHAFHSHHMDAMLDELATVAGGLSFAEPRVPVVSNLSGEPLSREQLADPGYWAQQARNTVRFSDGIGWLAAQGTETFLELGPEGVLSSMCVELLPAAAALPLLREGRPEVRTALGAAAQLWARGVAVGWEDLYEDAGARPVKLPTYAFQRERYWAPTFTGHAPADAADGVPAPEPPDALLRVDWKPVERTVWQAEEGPPGRWALLGDAQGAVGRGLAAAGVTLEAHTGLSSLTRAIEDGRQAPELVLLDLTAAGASDEVSHGKAGAERRRGGLSAEQLAARAGLTAEQALRLTQAWLADPRSSQARLVLLTRGAVPEAGDCDADLSLAAVWGLVRSAQLESPGRLVLVDCDGQSASWEALLGALALDEPQLALRAGEVLVPRLARVPEGGRAPGDDEPGPAFDSLGTVLVTGGTGGLGALVAKHLAREHNVGHLLLASRRGADAEGADRLERELAELGCEAELVACDVSDGRALRALLERVPSERPLRGVVHAAGVVDDGAFDSLDPERLHRVLAPKIGGALHLHELTESLDLRAFVLFSSVAGTFGKAGSASHAAANAFLDALAARRRAQGLPAVSIAWGPWALGGEAPGSAGAVVHALGADEGLELFDRACGADAAIAVAARVDPAILRVLADAGMLPPLLRGLAPPATRASRGRVGSLVRRLRELPRAERPEATLEAVRTAVATVLGHPSAAAVDPRRTFQELGFDSLTALELRNKLSAAADLQLPATLVFNHPTSTALAGYLLERIAAEAISGRAPLDDELQALEEAIAAGSLDGAERSSLRERLQAMVSELGGLANSEAESAVASQIRSATPEELIGLIDAQLGAG